MNPPEILTTIYSLFGLLLCIVAFVTIVSFAFLWHDQANRKPELFAERFSVKSIYIALRLIIPEVFYLMVTTIWKPAGLLPAEKYQPSEKIPVLLLHGLFHNRSCWFRVKRLLRKNNYTAIYSINLRPWRDIETLTEIVARKTDQIRHRHKVDKVAIIGHSMGGVVARNFLHLRGGGDKVAFLLTLGSPHHGSTLAPFSIWPLGSTAQPSHPLLARINRAPTPKGTKVTSIYSTMDNIIIPPTSSHIDDVQNIALDKMGHMGLIFSKRSLCHVIPALSLDGEV